MDEKDIYFYPKQFIDIGNIETNSFIIDIAGGGEGVIGQIAPDKTLAIDRSIRELKEAPGGKMKFQMDARSLAFKDQSVDLVTAFFGMMFMPMSIHRSVFSEIFRVLNPGGEFSIWDLNVRKPFDLSKKIYAARLAVQIPGKTISTGYGHPWPTENQDKDYYLKILVDIGFELVEATEKGQTFFMKLCKPGDC